MKKIFILAIFILTLLSGENILLKKGWNLKGSSYDIDVKNSKSKCFEGFWKYKNDWAYLKIGKDGIIEKDSGFWVKAKEDCNFSAIYSNNQKNDSIQIKKGWNLIGVTEEEWFSNIDTNLISNAFIYSTNKLWSDFLINSNNSFLLGKDRGIWIKSTKNLKLNYLNLKNEKNIFKGKLLIDGKVWDDANVTLDGIKAEGTSDINGNFVIKNFTLQDRCLNLVATKVGYESFKRRVDRNLQNGVKLCENNTIVTTFFSGTSYTPTSTTTPSTTVKNILESIFISKATLNLKIGETSNLKVIGKYTDNSQKDETSNVTFNVSNENVLSIDENGAITAKSAGDTQITATIGKLTANIFVKVIKSLESISLSITPTNLTLLKGESANLKVMGNYSDNSKEDLTSSATFTSSNEGNISIDSSGLISALNVGSSTIEVKTKNFSQTLNLNVIAKDTTIQGSDIMGSYSDLIASNATVEKFDEKRFCVLKGAIKEIDGMPLSNVEVSIKEHPEYGSVKSDINGEFAIAIEGGGVVTLRYIKDGFSIVDRQIEAPWSDIAIADDITMLKKDTKVTPIKLDGTKQVHSSTPYSDDRGVR